MAKGKYQKWLEPDSLTLLQAWARDGLVDEQIAKNMGIATGTLYEWKKKYSDIDEALKKGKEVVDIEVENALLMNATGYEYSEEVAFKCKRVYYDESGNRCEEEEIKIAKITKFRPAETAAAFIWLKNRKSKDWRDKPKDESDSYLLTKACELLGAIESAI